MTAVYECVKALSKDFSHIPVCAGGIKENGDIPIAFAAGAHSVMMGRMIAGTKEVPGQIITRPDGSRIKVYRGMGSLSALSDNQASASRERYNSIGMGLILPEGVDFQVSYEGKAEEVLGLCILALNKALRYVKAPNLEYHRQNTRLRRITNAGLRKSHPHDIEVIKR